MGYYLDLRFDLKSVPDWRTAVDRLCAAGAKVLPWEELDPDGLEMQPDEYARFVKLHAPQLPFIEVCKNAEQGHWANIRLSWATGNEFIPILADILTFAKRVGCRVYDGQQKEYVTEETLAELAGKFSKTARQISTLFGQVGNKPASDDGCARE